MISTIQIKNIGIIDDLSINLENGFNVLTGETGAGKTLIIDSLGIICGNRFSKEMIRKGEEYSYVEACIFMPENINSIDGNIIVSREIYNNGRNFCKINGRLVTVNELKEFMKHIIDIHGQNDNQTILDKSSHIGYLDSFIGKEILKIKSEYKTLYNNYNQIKLELKNNYGDEKEKQRKLDLLKYQVKEIEEVNLKEGEDEKLEEQRKLMINSEKIIENIEIADESLSNQAIDSINSAIKALEKIENIDESYGKKLSELKNVYYDIQEISRDISCMKEEVYFDENERNEIEERLDLIFSLKRKYGNSIYEILKYKEQIENEIYEVENIDEINNKLKQDLKFIESKMLLLSNKMSEIRKEKSEKLSKSINLELTDLEMKNAKFDVKVQYDSENNFNKNGLDEVEFLICTNIGEEEKSLIKIASGGEMSRIMLAIKSVLSEVDKIPSLIFDEIDIGISGIAAKAVGSKMKKISQNHQILCITHLANIAAQGTHNYYISKEVEDNKTKTKIEKLDEQSTIKEIARIASGDINDVSIEHAKQLMRII
ncbi:MAG: DNA repair protein RecN [Clostridiaceae bacterium]|nr:DNA repair protein RecN [Clostridiaceae bacterium]